MRRPTTAPVHVSRNHLEGSFADVPLDRILAACQRHLVTGQLRIATGAAHGLIELRAGAVDRAEFGDARGARALHAVRDLVDGWYELSQRLPDLTGALGGSASCQGDVSGVPLVALMRHCEYYALTCSVTVVAGFDRAELRYRAGELERVELNGCVDDDALMVALAWPDARFRLAAPPLDLEIEGWPAVRRAPTEPFALGRRFARGTSPHPAVSAPMTPPATPPADPIAPVARVAWTRAAPRPDSLEVELEFIAEPGRPAVPPPPTAAQLRRLIPDRALVLPTDARAAPSHRWQVPPWARALLATAAALALTALGYLWVTT